MGTPTVRTSSNTLRPALENRDFRLYWIGQSISTLGDQLHTIASVWLVLTLTGDPLTLGVVLALGGIPQALFSLFGGAIIDRFSPRRVMLLADVVRFMLSAVIAAAIFFAFLQTWMIFVYAFLMGAIYGIFGPASSSMIPRILPEKDLQTGNLLIQGSSQVAGILGPVLAAGFISMFWDDTLAIAILIAADSLTFLISILTLWSMHMGGEMAVTKERISFEAVMHSTREGISYVFNHASLHFLFLLIAFAGFAFSGPVTVGIPYLAEMRFPQGVAAFGFILSGYAAGNLLGILLSNRLPLRDKKDVPILLAGIFIAFGIGLASLAWISTTWLATLDLLIMGLLNGYISILLLTGLQRNTPQDMLGRVMSIVLFANLVLIPFSQAMAGALLRWNVEILFIGASALMIGAAIYIYASRDRDQIADQFL